MLRFLSRRSKRKTDDNSTKVSKADKYKYPPPASATGTTTTAQKPPKNCILCKVIILDGTDLSIYLPVRQL